MSFESWMDECAEEGVSPAISVCPYCCGSCFMDHEDNAELSENELICLQCGSKWVTESLSYLNRDGYNRAIKRRNESN